MNINVNLPQSFNELSFKQLANIALVRHQQTGLTQHLNGEALNYLNKNSFHKIVRELLRGKNFFKVLIILYSVPISEFSKYCHWVFAKVDRTIFPKKIRIGRRHFYGPEPRLVNVTVGEFAFADAMYYFFEKNPQQTQYLDYLCASLYRPKKGGKRLAFSKAIAEKNTKHFKKLPLRKKLAIAMAYQGSRNHKVGLYPNIFPKPPKHADPNAPKPKYEPFGKLIAHKINYDPSKLKEVEQMLIDKFFGIYENELKELKKQKK